MPIKETTVFVGLMGSRKPESSGSLATPVHLRRSGSLSLDPHSFKSTNGADTDSGNQKLQMICSSDEHLKNALSEHLDIEQKKKNSILTSNICFCLTFSYALLT